MTLNVQVIAHRVVSSIKVLELRKKYFNKIPFQKKDPQQSQ